MPSPPSPAPVRISVVVPTHNTRELTLRCLATIAAAEEVEVVVVDDASRDGTAEAISGSWRQVTVIRHEQAAGFTRSANDGLRQASGEILLLLNSDTEVEPGGFAALREAFARAPRLGVAGAALYYPDGSPQWSGGRSPSLIWLFALSSGLPTLLARLPFYRKAKPLAPPPSAAPLPLDWVTGAAMAIRRQAWEAAGPLDEDFRFYAQDLDFCVRLRRAGWQVEVLPAFRVLHHHGATIGKEAGARGHQHPELLWTDLLRWARKSQNPGWARKASLALRWGGVLRLAGRALATPFLAAARRPRWRAETAAFRRAVAAVRAL